MPDVTLSAETLVIELEIKMHLVLLNASLVLELEGKDSFSLTQLFSMPESIWVFHVLKQHIHKFLLEMSVGWQICEKRSHILTKLA